ncbi:TPA: hypothetical protein ACXN3C_003526 [Clostridioides difficile]|uniref:hypothetical protein n=1 Tax=Clostridioides difficile TaxID=1496 RepID=UPI00038D70A9|nr:hypothetical protein QCQ_4085 [Clostridioides difficile CD49]EQG22209.1 hypothetical protein QII_3016 [Clostridioides difficile DA00114]EQI32475.1 hypothetical protein QOU_3761 [Clostridioides difficile Y202]
MSKNTTGGSLQYFVNYIDKIIAITVLYLGFYNDYVVCKPQQQEINKNILVESFIMTM